jgi:Tat protein secretion system quality control protein TatD with DNase activity
MKFFQSEVVQKELTQMQDLYMEINRMGLMLNVSQKKEQLVKMLRLIELQQTMYMRVTLSEDPDAKQLVEQVKNAASMLGMPPDEVGPQFYDKLKDNVNKMIDQLPLD